MLPDGVIRVVDLHHSLEIYMVVRTPDISIAAFCRDFVTCFSAAWSRLSMLEPVACARQFVSKVIPSLLLSSMITFLSRESR